MLEKVEVWERIARHKEGRRHSKGRRHRQYTVKFHFLPQRYYKVGQLDRIRRHRW